MEKTYNQHDAFLFSELDLRTPLSDPPKEKIQLKFLNPLKWFVIIVLSGIFTGGVGTLFWYAYMQGYDQASAEHAPEIFPDPTPFKVRPQDPGGLQVPHQNRQVYEVMKGGAPADRIENLMPMPEAPLLREIPEEVIEPQTIDEPAVLEEVQPSQKKTEKKAPQKVNKVTATPEVKKEVQKPVKPLPKMRLTFGTLPSAEAAERELARLKYNHRTALDGIYLSVRPATNMQGYRIQSQQMDHQEAEKIQKRLKGQKITAILVK